MVTFISISGASASGKTSVARELLSFLPDARMLLSFTTRTPRPSDVPGEYRYVSEEAFAELEKESAFLWSVSVHGNRYGTLKESVHTALAGGIHIAILTILAAEHLAAFLAAHAAGTQFLPFYLRTGDERLLEERLRKRGDSPEDIRIRIEECQDWNMRAARSSFPFKIIDAGLPLGEMIAQTKATIELQGL